MRSDGIGDENQIDLGVGEEGVELTFDAGDREISLDLFHDRRADLEIELQQHLELLEEQLGERGTPPRRPILNDAEGDCGEALNLGADDRGGRDREEKQRDGNAT